MDTEKIDLIVFITAHIIKEGTLTAEEIEDIEIKLGQGRTKEEALIRTKE